MLGADAAEAGGGPGEKTARLRTAILSKGITLDYADELDGALGTSSGGRIQLLTGLQMRLIGSAARGGCFNSPYASRRVARHDSHDYSSDGVPENVWPSSRLRSANVAFSERALRSITDGMSRFHERRPALEARIGSRRRAVLLHD
jgi:hypothetical protein